MPLLLFLVLFLFIFAHVPVPLLLYSVLPDNMGNCQNYGPFLATLNIRCRFKRRTQRDHNFDNHPHCILAVERHDHKCYCYCVVIVKMLLVLIGFRV